MDTLKYNKPNLIIMAKGNMSAIQQDILTLAIMKVDRNKKGFEKFYEIDIKEFSRLKNISIQAAHVLIHDAVKNFKKETYEVGEETITTGIISIKTTKGSSIVKIAFDTLIEDTFFNTPYTRGKLKSLYNLHSMYSKRIYDLLIQYKNMNWQGEERQRVFKINYFKELLGITDKYPRIFDLKKNVIDIAWDEINNIDENGNKLTDITIKGVEYLKNELDKRKIGSIKFIFKIEKEECEIWNEFQKERGEHPTITKMKEKLMIEDNEFSYAQLVELYSIAEEKAKNKDIDVYDYLFKNYFVVIKKGNEVKNKFAYFKTVLQDNYAK